MTAAPSSIMKNNLSTNLPIKLLDSCINQDLFSKSETKVWYDVTEHPLEVT